MMTCNKILEVYCKINSDYDMESNSLDENYQKYTKKIDSEYELIYWKKLNDLEHLSNQLYNLKRTEEQNGTETESKINEMKVVIPKDSIKQISASIVKQSKNFSNFYRKLSDMQ